MNWKKRYDIPKVGDKVRMIQPCNNCPVNDKEGAQQCYEDLFQGKLLEVFSIDLHDAPREYRVGYEAETHTNHCHVSLRTLKKV